jgi:hypothetical protein
MKSGQTGISDCISLEEGFFYHVGALIKKLPVGTPVVVIERDREIFHAANREAISGTFWRAIMCILLSAIIRLKP